MAKDPEERKFEGFDRVFPLVGGHHRYQWILLLVLSGQGVLAFHHMGYAFLGAVPNHWCEVEELSNTGWTIEQIKNISIPLEIKLDGETRYEQCSYYDFNYNHLSQASNFESAYYSVNFAQATKKSCSKWTYDKSVYKSTTVTDFDLVCDRKYLVATIQSTYMGGVFVGSLVLGALSDSLLGRRGCVLISTVLIIVSGFGASYATSYAAFVFFRFVIAIGVAGSFQNSFTILMEYSDTQYRAILGFIQQVPFAICYMLMALYAYFLRDWVDLQLAFSISTLILLSYFWKLPESSRWLASKNREEEASTILEGIAKTNKFPKPQRNEILEIVKACRNPEQEETQQPTAVFVLAKILKGFKLVFTNYVNLVRTRELRRRSFIIWYLFATVTLVYYGISFASPTLTDDPFILVFLGGLVEIPGYLGAIPLATTWGRKPTVAISFIISGLACGTVAVVPFEFKALRVSLSMIGKLFVSGAFAVIYLLATELYPTTERATGLGSAVLMGRLGSIIAPYVATMQSVFSDFPTVIFGVTSLIGGLVAFLLPETKGEEMLEHVKDVENVAARIRSASQHADELKAALKQAKLLRRESSMSNQSEDSRKNSVVKEIEVDGKKVDESVVATSNM